MKLLFTDVEPILQDVKQQVTKAFSHAEWRGQ